MSHTPTPVLELAPSQLATHLASRTLPLLIDVREPWEWEIARLDHAQLIPLGEIPDRIDALPRDANIVVYCHHGVRSRNVAHFLVRSGFEHVANLSGGIDRYARECDAAIPLY